MRARIGVRARQALAEMRALLFELRPVVLAVQGLPAAVPLDGRQGSMGLHSMRERAAAVGPALRVTRAPGAGTRVAVEAPLPAPGSLTVHSGGDLWRVDGCGSR